MSVYVDYFPPLSFFSIDIDGHFVPVFAVPALVFVPRKVFPVERVRRIKAQRLNTSNLVEDIVKCNKDRC